jgi:hypothetical protein
MVFSFSGKVQDRIVNGHRELMDAATIWAPRGKKWRAFLHTNRNQLKGVTAMELERRHIIKFLHMKTLKFQGIPAELSSAYGQDAYARLSIEYWLHQTELGRTDVQTQHVSGRPPLDHVGAEMLSLLRKFPFPSVRTIADSLNIHVSTIYSYLVERIGLRRVPHTLAGELWQKRVGPA